MKNIIIGDVLTKELATDKGIYFRLVFKVYIVRQLAIVLFKTATKTKG